MDTLSILVEGKIKMIRHKCFLYTIQQLNHSTTQLFLQSIRIGNTSYNCKQFGIYFLYR